MDRYQYFHDFFSKHCKSAEELQCKLDFLLQHGRITKTEYAKLMKITPQAAKAEQADA